MAFKSGDKAMLQSASGEYLVTVLGEKDFAGYKRNRPSDKWELVVDEDGKRFWTPDWTLRKVDDGLN